MAAKKELSELYSRTIESQATNREPKDGEFDAWLNVLRPYTVSDIDAALRRWQSDVMIEDFTGKPRGSRVPSAAELKVSIERFDRAHSSRFISCGNCEEGWVRVFVGQTAGNSDGIRATVDPKTGAVKRCHCFTLWATARKG